MNFIVLPKSNNLECVCRFPEDSTERWPNPALLFLGNICSFNYIFMQINIYSLLLRHLHLVLSNVCRRLFASTEIRRFISELYSKWEECKSQWSIQFVHSTEEEVSELIVIYSLANGCCQNKFSCEHSFSLHMETNWPLMFNADTIKMSWRTSGISQTKG